MRSDGRGATDIRQIQSMCGLLPRAHGSVLFTRGETQVTIHHFHADFWGVFLRRYPCQLLESSHSHAINSLDGDADLSSGYIGW